MPKKTDAEMSEKHHAFKAHFPPSHDQLDQANVRNVADGRELTVVNCWFLDDNESEKMWSEYALNSEGVAIKSTVRALAQFVRCDPRLTHIGKVQYVDLDSHSMTHYEANQAQERAFLKQLEFSAEKELRIVTMNFRGPMCVSMDGDPLGPDEWQGVGMNNTGNDGLYIRADLANLIKAIVLAPGVSTWHERLIKKLVRLTDSSAPVERSTIEN
ncbi:MAG: hypothetical protein Q8M24_11785 [Pseudolabrys sp.]|nr:hypothetical protein [Pseudolabrys sp.]MDP2296128.1 hypothetical protein [Pseudolabrys sp.]